VTFDELGKIAAMLGNRKGHPVGTDRAFRFLHRYRELSGHQPENCVDPIYEYTLFWI